jgi:hypothetical protein
MGSRVVACLTGVILGEGHHKGQCLKLKPWASCGVGLYGSIIQVADDEI